MCGSSSVIDNLKIPEKQCITEWSGRHVLKNEEVTFEPEDSAEVTGIEGVKLILRKKEEV